MQARSLVSLVVLTFLLAACSGEAGGTKQPPAGSDGGSKNAGSSSSEESPKVEIVDSGFGQGEYGTLAMVVVTTDSEAAIGEFVTASVNFLDEEGLILATADQIESFMWAGQELAMPVMPIDLDERAKVASIEPSVSLSDYGTSGQPKAPLPVLDSTEVKKGEFGGFVASFSLTNDTDSDLKSPRAGVVCYDAAKKIIGGTSAYPELVPAGKAIRLDAEPTVSGEPASCKAFVSYEA